MQPGETYIATTPSSTRSKRSQRRRSHSGLQGNRDIPNTREEMHQISEQLDIGVANQLHHPEAETRSVRQLLDVADSGGPNALPMRDNSLTESNASQQQLDWLSDQAVLSACSHYRPKLLHDDEAESRWDDNESMQCVQAVEKLRQEQRKMESAVRQVEKQAEYAANEAAQARMKAEEDAETLQRWQLQIMAQELQEVTDMCACEYCLYVSAVGR